MVAYAPTNTSIPPGEIITFTVSFDNVENMNPGERYVLKLLCDDGASTATLIKGMRPRNKYWTVVWHPITDPSTGSYDENVVIARERWTWIDIMIGAFGPGGHGGVFIANATLYFASPSHIQILAYSGVKVFVDGNLVVETPQWKYGGGSLNAPIVSSSPVSPGWHKIEVRAISLPSATSYWRQTFVSFGDAWWEPPHGTGKWHVKWYNALTYQDPSTWTLIGEEEWDDLNFGKLWGRGEVYGGRTDKVAFIATARLYFGPNRINITRCNDDGFKMYVDGVLRINQWQKHSTSREYAYFTVSEGFHDVEVWWFESRGSAVCVLDIQGVDWDSP